MSTEVITKVCKCGTVYVPNTKQKHEGCALCRRRASVRKYYWKMKGEYVTGDFTAAETRIRQKVDEGVIPGAWGLLELILLPDILEVAHE